MTRKYRFYCHVWTRANGHQDKRYLMTGDNLEDAFIKLCAALSKKIPGIVVAWKSYEEIRTEKEN
jgi:hypothetical protein